MNIDQAVQTITKRGFTVRQAQFLVLVARHSGVCVMRQYSTFAGIVFGQKTRKFFDKLVRSGFVSTYDCAHGRGRVYHVRHRAIYEAIGEPDSRLRRPPGVPRALERLMLLDAVLLNPDNVWMSSRAEKVDYFSKRGITTDDCPHRTVRQGDRQLVRPFPDLLPIGVHPSGHVVFVYLYADPLRDEFRDFLQRHAPLLERLPAWTLRIVVPPHLAGVPDRLQKMAWGHLASPLSELLLTEARWYFAHPMAPGRRRHLQAVENPRAFQRRRHRGALRAPAEGGSGGRQPTGPDPGRSKRRGRKCRADAGSSSRPRMTGRSCPVGFRRGWPHSYS